MLRRRKNGREIYHYRSPLKIILISVGSVLLAALLLFVAVFFGFRKYAVYTDEGVTVEVPWLDRGSDGESAEQEVSE